MSLLLFSLRNELLQLLIYNLYVRDFDILVPKLILQNLARSRILLEFLFQFLDLLFDQIDLSLVFVLQDFLLLEIVCTYLAHFMHMFQFTCLTVFE